MDTAQEALFKAMLQNDWFTASDGETDFSLGYFGYVHNHPDEWFEVSQNFCEVLSAYAPDLELGAKAPEWFSGVFFASINDQGVIRIEKVGDVLEQVTSTYDFAHNRHVVAARYRFDRTVEDYIDWNNTNEEDV